jgi:hypothetical protein
MPDSLSVAQVILIEALFFFAEKFTSETGRREGSV